MSLVSNAAEVAAVGRRVLIARLGGASTRGGVAILLDPAGRLLLTLARYRRGWNFPGGFFEPGEQAEQGLRRELTEEVAYPADAPTPIVIHTSSRANHLEHFGVADLNFEQSTALHCVSWELRGAKWFGPAEMPNLDKHTIGLISNGEAVLAVEGNRWVWGERTISALKSPEHHEHSFNGTFGKGMP